MKIPRARPAILLPHPQAAKPSRPGIADEEGATALGLVVPLCAATIFQALAKRVDELRHQKGIDISFGIPLWRLEGMPQKLADPNEVVKPKMNSCRPDVDLRRRSIVSEAGHNCAPSEGYR
ncbi:hypothetical protein EV129_11721 [Rhizobium azibense]|uniref:Uncharacterized protein n=2 Tax=Rhizobium TaxID=379 RepID=A0A4R3RER1_9HYPH|nr:hypothetical protein EV129_11721 [Rhizobium azibense]TDW34187.1 hypothetical protein EV128_104194 [Rhizobium azibense]